MLLSLKLKPFHLYVQHDRLLCRLGSAKQNPTIDNQGYDGAMQYRRAKNLGSSYFFTLVTHNRRPILCVPENIELLRDSFKQVLVRHPFKIDAIVIVPDHLHCIWTLPPADADFSLVGG